jgi:hypothetical protein
MENKMRLSTPVKTYSFYDQNDEFLFELRFDPSDIGIMERAEEVEKRLESLQPKDETEVLNASKEVKKQIDYLLNTQAADRIFAVSNPFSLLDSGKFFVEEVLGAINKLIEKEMKGKMKKVSRRAEAYAANYQSHE